MWNYKGSSYKYIYVKDIKGIMEMIQMGVIEIHPWGATIDNIHTPDRMIFDLDPDVSVPFPEGKRRQPLIFRKRLTKAGLESFLKCTGRQRPAYCGAVATHRQLGGSQRLGLGLCA